MMGRIVREASKAGVVTMWTVPKSCYHNALLNMSRKSSFCYSSQSARWAFAISPPFPTTSGRTILRFRLGKITLQTHPQSIHTRPVNLS